jgi:hypothetical protein
MNGATNEAEPAAMPAPDPALVTHGVISPLASAPDGVGAAVLDAARADVLADPAEQAWLADRDLASEAAFLSVAAPLFTGGGVMRDQTSMARLGRNLFTEGEHAANASAARDLLEAPGPKGKGATADEIAALGADDPGVRYLRENADSVIDGLATKQAKAAQELLDTYTEVAKLRPDPDDVASELADNAVDQARWVTRTRAELEGAVEGLPPELGKSLRAKLGKLADGDDPAKWFTRASELSDELQRARSKAARAGVEGAPDALARAKTLLDGGLADEGLWGGAARAEGQRAAGYARRYGEHIEAFENAFSAEVGGTKRATPEAFRRLLSGEADPDALRALDSTLESARATADVASKFGRKEEAARIRRAIATFERTGAQAKAIGVARQGVSRETNATAEALEFLAGGPSASTDAASARLTNRSAVFRAAQGMTTGLASGNRRGVQALLSRPLELDGEGDDGAGGLTPPPLVAGVTSDNYDATRDHIEKMATDPAYFASTMAASFGTLPEAAPEVYSALSAQTAKVAQYLNAVAPGGKSGGPFGERIPVAEDELWEFNERMRASTSREFVRTELAAGRLSSQAIESYELMHPKAYARLQRDVWERLHELKEQGIPVSVQAREQIDTLLNIDGGGDPALTWKVAERAYAAQQRKDALQPSSGAVDTSEHTEAMTSGALSTLGNGASAIAQTG